MRHIIWTPQTDLDTAYRYTMIPVVSEVYIHAGIRVRASACMSVKPLIDNVHGSIQALLLHRSHYPFPSEREVCGRRW